MSASLPPIITSVPRLMPSISECRQPYLLSNLLLVTESLTLIAGNSSVPVASNSTPMWISSVASPPSSTMESGPVPSGQVSICSVHHQYSSSVSPFQANTGTPVGFSGVPSGPTTTAAAAWSWVEKMLQLTQRTSAPSAASVSMRTAVCTVMCSDPATFLPRSGCCAPYSLRRDIRQGISCSASWISLRPNGASDRSATLKSVTAPAESAVRARLTFSPSSTGTGNCSSLVSRR